MATNDRTVSERPEPAGKPRTRFFAVRLWTEEVVGGSEYRGTVQDVVSRAFCHFRDWPDLTAFMIARMEENERARTGCEKGGTPWLSEEQR
jgi:hypothetical protein